MCRKKRKTRQKIAAKTEALSAPTATLGWIEIMQNTQIKLEGCMQKTVLAHV